MPAVTRLSTRREDDDNVDSDVRSSRHESWGDRLLTVVTGPPGWREKAPVTRIFIWLNIVVFLGEVVLSRRTAEPIFPGFSSHTLLAFGANYALATFREQRSEALVAACFVHGSLLHMVFNMFALRNVGPLVEEPAGSARTAPLYLASGIGGSLASALYGLAMNEEPRISVGASGAIFGLIGAAVVVGWRTEGFRGELTQTMLRWLGFFLGFGLVIGFSIGGLDNAAHVGGAATGIVTALIWRPNAPYSPRARQWIYSATAAVLVATAIVVLARTLVSPYSVMLASERLDATQDALDGANCPEARRALGALKRLHPDGGDVRGLAAVVDQRCGAAPLRVR